MAGKYPQLEEMRAKLLKRKAEIRAASAELRKERDELRAKVAPALTRLRELDDAIHKMEQPELRGIEHDLVGLVKAIGPVKEDKELQTITKEDVGTLDVADIVK